MDNKIKSGKCSVGEILYTGWDVFIKQIKPILAVVLLICIPINIITYLINMPYISGAINFLFGILAVIGVVLITEKHTNNAEIISWKEIVNASCERWVPVVWANIFVGIILALLSIPLIIVTAFLPAYIIVTALTSIGKAVALGIVTAILSLLFAVVPIIYAVHYSLVIQTTTLGKACSMNALTFSRTLVKGDWWKVLWLSICIGVISILVLIILELIFGFTSALSIVSYTIFNIVTAYFVIAYTLLFLNFDYLKNGVPVNENTAVVEDKTHNIEENEIEDIQQQTSEEQELQDTEEIEQEELPIEQEEQAMQDQEEEVKAAEEIGEQEVPIDDEK